MLGTPRIEKLGPGACAQHKHRGCSAAGRWRWLLVSTISLLGRTSESSKAEVHNRAGSTLEGVSEIDGCSHRLRQSARHIPDHGCSD
jgi:hypothetical protein